MLNIPPESDIARRKVKKYLYISTHSLLRVSAGVKKGGDSRSPPLGKTLCLNYFLRLSGSPGAKALPLYGVKERHIFNSRGKTSWAGTHQSV
jgi:hypothetical protein